MTKTPPRLSERREAFRVRLRIVCILLLTVVAGAGLFWRANSLAESARKPAKATPRAEIAKKLESSQRFDISPQAIEQIAALEAEKESRTATERKIDSQLLQAVRESRGGQMAAGAHLDRANVDADNAGVLAVDIAATVNDDLLLKIEALGGEIIYPSWEYHTIRARVNLSVIEAIAGYSEVKFIEPAVRYQTQRLRSPTQNLTGGLLIGASFAERAERVRRQISGYLKTNANGRFSHINLPRVPAGTVNSEGDRTHRADDTRNTYGYQGFGVRIGVLSDSFDNRHAATADILNGNLPGPGNPLGHTTPVTVLQDLVSGGTDEGRAMLQIVHDLAPEAQLFFATANGGPANFAANIQALRSAPNNCDIIIDDVFYFSESPFQDGIIAQAVDTVTASGALYFSSAGNGGSLAKNTAGVFEGDFNDAGSAPFSGSSKPGTIHNFGTVVAPVNGDIITASGAYLLFWADPAGASNNDYDLFLVSSDGTVKGSSTNVQNGAQSPFEQILPSGALAAGDRLVVFKSTPAAARAFHLDTVGGRLTVATTGNTHGHSCAANAFGVGATPARGPFPNPFSSGNQVETFTADGPRRIFFNSDGTAITPGNLLFATSGGTVRNKPDVTAADGVSTTLPSGSGLNPFFGTSAAAPHAGAIAALIKSASPALTPAQMRTILTTTTIDIEAAGYDAISGFGIIQAFQAMQAVNPTTIASVNTGDVSVTERSGNGNGVIEPGETGSLIVQLTNPSLVAATNVNATLATSTAGIAVTQPSASYGTIAPGGNATNSATPFVFTIDTSVPCGTVITFMLTVNLGGGAGPQSFLINQNVGAQPGLSISSKLGQTPPTAPGFTSNSGQQMGRLNRNGASSSCATPKPTPPIFDPGNSRSYDAYTFTNTNSTSQCVTVKLTVSGADAAKLYNATYNSSGFVPTDPTTNYLADPGVSGTTTSYSFTAPPGQPFTVVVHDVNAGAASQTPYTLSVSLSNCPGVSAPPTPTPTPTPTPDPNCVVINGSFESNDFTGWTVFDSGAAAGSWYVYTGANTPVSGFSDLFGPPTGTHAAVSDQTGPGTHILYQDIPVPTGQSWLSFFLYYRNRTSAFATPPTLSSATTPNQQYRVDLVKTTAPVDSLAAGDVLSNLFITNPGDPLVQTPTFKVYDTSGFAGQTVRLRFAEVATQFVLNASVDGVCISKSAPTPPPTPTPTPSGTTIQFSAVNYTAGAGDGLANITVTRSGNISIASSVRFATSDLTAKEGRDYTAAYGGLSFASGEERKTFPVLIINNSYVGGTRTVNLVLSNPLGATLSTQSTATLTINNSNTVNGPNPIDQARFFAQQHYYDFLGRYPDQAGWDFWTSQIASCGTNQTCIDDKRNNVSASFFLSIEFQQTGFLVERMYKAAYGDATGSSTIGGAHQLSVPIVRFNEFLPDTQRIGQGVVVGQTGWEAALETNKQAFANEFVQRSRFTAAYPTSMTPAQFVDALFAKAGVTPSDSDRNAPIREFGFSATNISDVAARGRALRRVAENSALTAREFNRAFVLMQYFGYLRRNPNDPPEATLDHSGYDFWLNKLNFFNGNYIQAEMVKAFITSIEYRQRFGS